MGFDAIFDVISKILKEPVPEGVSPILSLGKTDKERLVSKQKVAAPDDSVVLKDDCKSSLERRRWLREAYKVPLAAAGLVHSRTSLTQPNRTVDCPMEQIEWERARERRLRSQATRGVISLFNSVRQHQSTISSYVDRTDLLPTQKEKILTEITTNDFLDRLSAGLPKSKHSNSLGDGELMDTTAARLEPAAKKARQVRTTFGRKAKNASGK